MRPRFWQLGQSTLLLGLCLTGPSAARAGSNDPADLLQQATQLQNAGKYKDAAIRWQQFIKEHDNDPALPQAYQGLGACLLETGNYQEAIAAIDKALAGWPKGEPNWSLRWNRAVASYRRAEESHKADDQVAAAQALQAIGEDRATPADRQALLQFYLGRMELTQGNSEAARKRFLRLLEGKADKSVVPHVLLALAGQAEKDKDSPEAEKQYRAFLAAYADHASADDARLGLADVLLQSKKDTEAEPLFAAVAQARQTRAPADYARFRWGELAFRRAEYEQAAERLNPFVSKYQDSSFSAPALLLLGEAHLQRREFAAAQTVFERFLKDHADHAGQSRARLGVCLCQFESGKTEESEAGLKPLLADIKDADIHVEAALLFARCATATNRPRDAVDRFVVLFKLKGTLPDPKQATLEAVQAAFAAKDSERGLSWLGDLEETDPASPQTNHARLHAARWLAENGRFNDSLPYSRRIVAVESAPERPQAFYLIGFCSMKLRKFDDAVKAYQTILDDYPKFEQAPAACYSLALAHESLGAKTKAIEIYQVFLKRFPTDSLAPRVQQRLEQLQAQP